MEDWSDDIYFQKEYGFVNEQIELGKSVHYSLDCDYGKIIHTFIKREIPLQGKIQKCYDIRTPYGYGGPLITKCDNKKKLLSEYESDFGRFCQNEHIISEFIRFHPLANNAIAFSSIYRVSFDRYTVGTNLGLSDDPIGLEFSKKCRKNIRRALNKGLSYSIIECPESIDPFLKIYYETMDRNDANGFYYFGYEYFDRLLSSFRKELLVIEVFYEDRLVAAGLYFVSHKTLHIHLSGTLNEYLHLNPPYVLRYAAAKWAIVNGLRYIHHGGGRSPSADDSLYKFKKQFGLNTDFRFFLGERIWDEKLYTEVVKDLRAGETINDYIRRVAK